MSTASENRQVNRYCHQLNRASVKRRRRLRELADQVLQCRDPRVPINAQLKKLSQIEAQVREI